MWQLFNKKHLQVIWATSNILQWPDHHLSVGKGFVRKRRQLTQDDSESSSIKMHWWSYQYAWKPASIIQYSSTHIVELHLFKHQKENLGDGEVIISGDFRKNYSLKHQNEIMSAHWTQEQVSLFCSTVHYSKDDVKKHQHYVLCSNDLGYDKDSIYFYNK